MIYFFKTRSSRTDFVGRNRKLDWLSRVGFFTERRRRRSRSGRRHPRHRPSLDRIAGHRSALRRGGARGLPAASRLYALTAGCERPHARRPRTALRLPPSEPDGRPHGRQPSSPSRPDRPRPRRVRTRGPRRGTGAARSRRRSGAAPRPARRRVAPGPRSETIRRRRSGRTPSAPRHPARNRRRLSGARSRESRRSAYRQHRSKPPPRDRARRAPPWRNGSAPAGPSGSAGWRWPSAAP